MGLTKVSMYEAFAEYVRNNAYVANDVKKVIDVRQETESGGYCHTCWYEEVVVYVDYIDSNDDQHSYRYYGNMAELIEELTRG